MVGIAPLTGTPLNFNAKSEADASSGIGPLTITGPVFGNNNTSMGLLVLAAIAGAGIMYLIRK